MAITEIALLRLLTGITTENGILRTELSHAKQVMEKFTHHTFHYYQQTEDPALIYVFGEWDSLNQHMKDFIPGSENQGLLKNLKDMLAVEWLLHIDTPHADLPFPTTANGHDKGTFISISRYFIKDGEKEKFGKSFTANEHYRNNFVTEGQPGGGWRIDKDGDHEEWVAICPWKGIQQYRDFAKSEECSKFLSAKAFTERTEFRHAKLLAL